MPKNESFFLFGPRQTGKSTLLRSTFSEKTSYYYDLLKTEEFARLAAHPALFRDEVLSRGPQISHIIVDEVQRVPELLNEIHLLIETKNAPAFAISGSSARKLKRSRANMLAGRALSCHLHPLTAKELGGSFSLNKALQLGTIPVIYLEPEINIARDRLRSYVEVYLKEEIELEAKLRNIGAFIHFLTLAANENGNIINFSNLSRETGISYQTVKSYFQILEDTLIGNFLFPYGKSERRRLSKHPKFYFFDPGVVRALAKKTGLPIEPRTPDHGKAFEHFVLLEIMRQADYQRSDLNFSYYRTESGAEVDLIVETPKGEVLAVEIKATDSVDSTHLRGLRSFSEVCPSAKLCCASLAPHPRQADNIIVLPWQEVFAWLLSS